MKNDPDRDKRFARGLPSTHHLEVDYVEQEINNMFYQSRKILEHQSSTKLELKPKSIAINIRNLLYKQPTDQQYRYFFWPSASLTLALEVGYFKTKNKALLDTLVMYYKRWERKGSRLYFLDQIMNGYVLLSLFEIHKDPWIKELLKKMYEYFKSYPRTGTGSMPYRIDNPEVVLIDYLGMICPFLSRYGSIFSYNEASHNSAFLLENFLLNGMNDKMGLPYHGFRSDTHEKLGIIGWGRGVGWLLIGIVDTLAFLDRTTDEFHSLYNHFCKLINSILEFQDDNGYFKWMLNADEGHVDTSATAMIGYSIKRGIDLDLLDIKYAPFAERSLLALLTSTKNGLVFDSLAECQGLSMHPQRYEWNLWGQGFGTAFAGIMIDSGVISPPSPACRGR
jgi:rhamnogalacturonyl hydrolase YesR